MQSTPVPGAMWWKPLLLATIIIMLYNSLEVSFSIIATPLAAHLIYKDW